MAIHTSGGLQVASLDRFAMEAAIVRSLLVSMTSRAADFPRRGFVGRTLHIGVAVHACEHASVDRVLESLRIDMQAHWLAADVVS